MQIAIIMHQPPSAACEARAAARPCLAVPASPTCVATMTGPPSLAACSFARHLYFVKHWLALTRGAPPLPDSYTDWKGRNAAQRRAERPAGTSRTEASACGRYVQRAKQAGRLCAGWAGLGVAPKYTGCFGEAAWRRGDLCMSARTCAVALQGMGCHVVLDLALCTLCTCVQSTVQVTCATGCWGGRPAQAATQCPAGCYP